MNLRWTGIGGDRELSGAGGGDGLPVVSLGPVTGWSQEAVTEPSSAAAMALVDTLMDQTGNRSVSAGDLAIADRDRLLAAVYVELYGNRVETTLTCGACHQLFDLDFSLVELIDHCEPVLDPTDSANWTLNGWELRPPTGTDQLSVAELDPGKAAVALLERVCPQAGVDRRQEVAERLEQVAPTISAPVGAVCPECGHDHAVTFDIESYLLRKLTLERQPLLGEVHLLASTYGWSRDEILSLPRSDRHSLAAMIEADRRSGHTGSLAR